MSDTQTKAGFDFTQHEQTAVTEYLKVASFYDDLSQAVKRIVEECLRNRDIRVNAVEARAKDPASFGRKAAKPSESDPNKPMYAQPLKDIQDLAAVRIITFFPKTLEDIDQMLKEEFEVTELSNKGEVLLEEEKFGYQSIHYLVKMKKARAALPEYQNYKGDITEVQVRTVLQHAWAEIEHDIQYKSSTTIPRDIRRRFMALAGLLEMADREFQAIQDADEELGKRASESVAQGQLGVVEITPRALKEYLDKTLSADGRVSEYSYDWLARQLKRLGFVTLDQVEECIRPYGDGDKVSRAAFGARQGQNTRFEVMLLAGMGEKYIERHLWNRLEWFRDSAAKDLKKIKEAKIPIGNYDPTPPTSAPQKDGGPEKWAAGPQPKK